MQEEKLKQEIVEIGRKLYDFRLVAAKGGNLSSRLANEIILITSSGSCLGELSEKEILRVNLCKDNNQNIKDLTTEFPLHSLIYKNFSAQSIIHCHPPLINAYYSLYDELKSITFEDKLFLGKVPVVKQSTPSVTKPEEVIEALKSNNIVVIKNHGVVAIGDKFQDCFYLIEILEETVKMAGFARLFAKESPDLLDKELKTSLDKSGKVYPMFSKEHILAIVDLINQDEHFNRKAKELSLTVKLAIKIDEDNAKIYKFHFQEGKIIKIEYDDEAPFIISGPAQVWRSIFLGKLDPFVATTQGKLKLKGQLGQLSRWYVPFTRMFVLFKEVRIQ